MAHKPTVKKARAKTAGEKASQQPAAGPGTTAPREPASQAPENTNHQEASGQSIFDLPKMVSVLFASLGQEPPSGSAEERDDLVRQYIRTQITGNPLSEAYNILVVHDEGRMVSSDADDIYSASAAFTNKRPILLVLYSTGGAIGSAYLIGKLCREHSNGRFVVVVPRQAKSAATLICCAADEIHMGSLSELGPIDPVIDGLPALGLKTSVEHIADLIKEHPHAADMFAKYLHMSLEPIHLGYYERVAESAAQYAERLLHLHQGNLKQSPAEIAKSLVYSYKDHGFVIDKAEAAEILGDKVVHTNTDEYRLGNSIYAALMFVSRLADMMNHYFYFVGSIDSKPRFTKRTRR